MDILLIAGLWLGAPVWDNVAAQLRAHGHRSARSPCRARVMAIRRRRSRIRWPLCSRPLMRLPGGPWWRGIPRRAAWPGSPRAPARPRSARSSSSAASPVQTASHTSAAFPSRMARCPSRAGANSRGRTPPIWTTRPSRPSRRLRSRCRKGSRAAWSGWPASAAVTSRWWSSARSSPRPGQGMDQPGRGARAGEKQQCLVCHIDSGHWPMISAPAGLARLLAQAAAES